MFRIVKNFQKENIGFFSKESFNQIVEIQRQEFEKICNEKMCNRCDLNITNRPFATDEELVKYWKDNKINIKPFPGYEFGVKKPLSNDCKYLIKHFSREFKVPIFSRTSCIISYMHNLDRDYNAHYYRPNELECDSCVMNEKCKKFKENQNDDSSKFKDIIPFDFEIIYKQKHKCYLHDKCKYPTSDCSNINGFLIDVKQKITLADLRVIKWLTGYTINAEFIDSPFISSNWMSVK